MRSRYQLGVMVELKRLEERTRCRHHRRWHFPEVAAMCRWERQRKGDHDDEEENRCRRRLELQSRKLAAGTPQNFLWKP